jgi:hypothetical protein
MYGHRVCAPLLFDLKLDQVPVLQLWSQRWNKMGGRCLILKDPLSELFRRFPLPSDRDGSY